MSKKVLKKILLIVAFMFGSLLFANNVNAAYVTISLDKTTASPGETITGTISSDCVGRVNLTSTNGTISTDRVWIENSPQSFTVTVGSEGTTAVSAVPENGIMSSGGQDVGVSGASALISVVSQNNANTPSTNVPSEPTTNVNEETPTTTTLSNNANLSNLGITPNDFTGFRPNTTTYDVTVPEDVESVEVYATLADSAASISGTGIKSLAIGLNTFNVVVTAENRTTTKTYTLNITREGTTEETEEPEENTENVEEKNGLSNIQIGDLELNPSFSTDVYEYTVKYIGEETSLDIQAVATDSTYTVEIVGNEDLKEGNNTVTILVSDEEGNNVATYQVTINKSLVDEEALAREEEERQRQEQMQMLIIAGGVIALIVIIIIVILVKRRKNRAYAEEFSGVPFAGINDEEDYYDDDDYDTDENNDNSVEENNYDENYIDDENTEDNKIDDEDNEIEEKKKAKMEYLNSYDLNNDEFYDEERTSKKGRKKGKRFK